MTVEELKKAINQVKAEDYSDEEILGAFYRMFQNDEISLEDLDNIVNLMGYHLTEDFKNMSPEDQKTKGVQKTDKPVEEASKEEVDEAKETDGEEEDKKDESEKPEDKKDDEPEDEEDKSDESEDEEDEEKKAMKLFGQK